MGMPMGMSSCSCSIGGISECFCGSDEVRIKRWGDSENKQVKMTVNQKAVENPNPYIFEIKKIESVSRHTVVMVNYPNCTNFEGNKILVYHNTKLKDVVGANKIDPHFCQNCEISPFARFEPTELGWEMAVDLCERIDL